MAQLLPPKGGLGERLYSSSFRLLHKGPCTSPGKGMGGRMRVLRLKERRAWR